MVLKTEKNDQRKDPMKIGEETLPKLQIKSGKDGKALIKLIKDKINVATID